MKLDILIKKIESLAGFIGFDYLGKACGIDPINHSHYEMWCGENYKVANSIDEVMNIKLFEGKALAQIYKDIDNIEY